MGLAFRQPIQWQEREVCSRVASSSCKTYFAGPVPAVLLQEASVVLARRVIYLEVTGTAHNPVDSLAECGHRKNTRHSY